jgi:uncharacterized membrane protein YccC
MTSAPWISLQGSGDRLRASVYRSLGRSNERNRRSRHALKTTAAVVIATLLFAWSDIQTRLMAGVAAAFLMQCVGVGPKRYQMGCMLGAAVAMLLEAGVGPALEGHAWVKYALLVLVAYGVVEVRRHLRDHGTYPLFLFTFFVLTTGLPGGLLRAQREMGAVAAAFAIAFVLTFWVSFQSDVPKPGTCPGSRTGARTALAALLAVTIALLFALPRAYWAILTAVVLVSETWQESAKKAFQRVGMTAFGCAIAFALHLPTRNLPHVELALMFLFVYLAVYFRNASYPLMTFFITLYVAFLFSVLGEWTLQILVVRIYETSIGGATALAAAFIVRKAMKVEHVSTPVAR